MFSKVQKTISKLNIKLCLAYLHNLQQTAIVLSAFYGLKTIPALIMYYHYSFNAFQCVLQNQICYCPVGRDVVWFYELGVYEKLSKWFYCKTGRFVML